MNKYAYAFAALLAFGAQAQSAEITVAADSGYFAGWGFIDMSPNGIAETIQMGNGESVVGTMNGAPLTWTVTSRLGTAAGIFTNERNIFGNNLPAGISSPVAPNRPAHGFLDNGVVSFNVPSPFAAGTTLFLQDVDDGEVANIRFYDCAGVAVDAGDFDFLKISTINTPPYAIMGAAPNRYWNVTAVLPSDPNTVNGIVIRSSSVCKIEITGTRPTNGGSINYGLGAPPNTAPTVTPAIAGTPQVGDAITGTYSYTDPELDPENATSTGSTYKFVTSPNPTIATSGDGTTVGSGSTGGIAGPVSYTLLPSDLGMYVYYCVTPVAATGVSAGVEVCSAALAGPVVAKPVAPVTAAPQPVPSLTGFSLAGLGSLMLLLGAIRRKKAQ